MMIASVRRSDTPNNAIDALLRAVLTVFSRVGVRAGHVGVKRACGDLLREACPPPTRTEQRRGA
jgi:hypothetical protein